MRLPTLYVSAQYAQGKDGQAYTLKMILVGAPLAEVLSHQLRQLPARHQLDYFIPPAHLHDELVADIVGALLMIAPLAVRRRRRI